MSNKTKWHASNCICPSCGSPNTEYDTTMVLTSNPPQYQCRCKDCGKEFSSRTIHQENLTLGGSNISNNYYLFNYGWICPRCGKVNAPHVTSCDCSTNSYYPPNIVYCNSPSVAISDVNINKEMNK